MIKKERNDEITLNKNYLNSLIHYMEVQHIIEDEKRDQLQLDFQKWLASEKALEDLSGEMPYCKFCKYQKDYSCTVSQEQRLEERLCAKSCKVYTEEMLHEKYKNFTFSKID